MNRCKPFLEHRESFALNRLAFGGLTFSPNGEAMSFIGKLKFKARREKLFGDGRPLPLDRNAKARVQAKARALMQRTEKGKAYGSISAKAYEVLRVLLWEFHNARTGLCFPSYESIAEKAKCARSTVAEAIKALEDAGLLSWVNRIKRVAEASLDLFGQRIRKTRVIRTSNGYQFHDPQPVNRSESFGNSSKSDFPSGTSIQALPLIPQPPTLADFNPSSPLELALLNLGQRMGAIA